MFLMKRKLFSLCIIPALLTGCSNKISLEFVPLTSFIEPIDVNMEYPEEYFYRPESVKPVSYKDGTIDSLNSLFSASNSDIPKTCLQSKGDRKLLVVPIAFNDSDESTFNDKTIYIQNAFFGEKNHTNYDSVSGYYNKSSYGQVRLTGEVAPWFKAEIDSSNWQSISTTYTSVSSYLVSQAIDYLKENSDIDFTHYDIDDDGYIDAIYAIYDHPLDQSGETSTLFWAYTYYARIGEAGFNTTEPYAKAYGWTSVDTIIQKYHRSYTNYLIHETGHLFGLEDYYNIFSSGATVRSDFHYQPTGCFDMMDYNIGDHSSFSKYLLNWSSPLVVKPGISITYKLKSFIQSGQYLLVPSSDYDDSPFSEYLLVEYFTPDSLNRFSGSYTYVDRNGKVGVYNYPQHHGLRIYHVNARLGYFQKGRDNSNMLAFINDPNYSEKIAGKQVGVNYAYKNSMNDAKADAGEQVLVHLLESSGNNTFINGVPANNETLFKIGDDFGINTFKDFKFSNGEHPNFTLKVKTLSEKDITLEISTK